MFPRDGERAAVAGRRVILLAAGATAPDRAYGVNHKTRGQFVALRDFGIAGSAAAELAAFREEIRPRRAMDRTVDAASAKQRGIGSIDDSIDIKPCDVLNDNFEHGTLPLASMAGRVF